MEIILISSLICYAILITYGVGSYYRENKVLRKQNEELLKVVTTQKAFLYAQQDNDLDRQLNNMFNYNGTAVGQVKRGDE